MKTMSLKHRNALGRSLKFEALENRRLLAVDLVAGGAHAALVRHDPGETVEVAKADPGGNFHAQGNGKHLDPSGADPISATTSVRDRTDLHADKPIVTLSTDSKTATLKDNSIDHSDPSSVGEKNSKGDNSPDLSGSKSTDPKDGSGSASTDPSGSSKDTHSESDNPDSGSTNTDPSDGGSKDARPDSGNPDDSLD